jgi:multidrug efflux system outer membrane protein
MRRFTFVLAGCGLLTAALTSCAVGPNYSRPSVPAPPEYRNATETTGASLAETKWFDLFHDETLTKLVETALNQNHDVRIAFDRILEARGELAVTRANELPNVTANAGFNAVRNSRIGQSRFVPAGISLDSSYTYANFTLNWELDLFGRLRRQSEAARAQYLGTEEAAHGVISTLVADVTSDYFRLLELDQELQIARDTLKNAQDGLQITTARHDRGAATGLDVSQAQQFLYTATAQIASIERQINETENAISFLVGSNPGDVIRGKSLANIALPPQIPAGLPSELLERRPDIRQTEQSLIAANANIGVAKSYYFPQISLTTVLGSQSRALSQLFVGPARAWNFAVPAATYPIFNAGAVRAAVKVTEAQKDEAIENYRKSIQSAFREVSDSLIAYRKGTEQREQQQLLVNALIEGERLSRLRYTGGLDSYLQVLDAQRNLFAGQLTLSQLRRDEMLSVVQLYRALGGGWQQ